VLAAGQWEREEVMIRGSGPRWLFWMCDVLRWTWKAGRERFWARGMGCWRVGMEFGFRGMLRVDGRAS
jgi:hypothetical protein